VLQDKVPGDLIETGVWRGGATILMRATLAAYGDDSRSVWVTDSFEGLPKPNGRTYAADDGWDLSVHPELAVGVDIVKTNFARYGLLDDRVKFLVGWFRRHAGGCPYRVPRRDAPRWGLLRVDDGRAHRVVSTLVIGWVRDHRRLAARTLSRSGPRLPEGQRDRRGDNCPRSQRRVLAKALR
jgi:hypothetical protein